MKTLKTWAPLIGSAALVGVVVLRMLGQTEAADAVAGIAGVLGLDVKSPVSLVELTTAIAAGTGIVLKVKAKVDEARAQ
jgi:hypothetical protein